MATKSKLFVLKDFHKKVNAAAKKDFQLRPFELVVNGPDDRRVDKALNEDRKLAEALWKACQKPADEFARQAAQALSAAQAAYDRKRSDDPQRTPEALRSAFAAFEQAVEPGTTKVWKAFVVQHAEYRGARFLPMVSPWSADYTGPDAAPKAPAESKELASATVLKDLGPAIAATAKGIELALKKAVEELGEARSIAQKVNETLDAIQKGYESQPRESQQEDAETDPEDEPDEDALDLAILNRFGTETHDAWTAAGTAEFSLDRAHGVAVARVKELNNILLKLDTGKRHVGPADPDAKALNVLADAAMGAVTSLTSAATKSRTAHKRVKATGGVLMALMSGKTQALGLVRKSRLDVPIPVDEFQTAREKIKPLLAP